MTGPRTIRSDECPGWETYFSAWLKVHASGDDEADRVSAWGDFLDHIAVNGESTHETKPMSIFPPSGIDDNAAAGSDPKWTQWFAWFPVEVDAYEPNEIKNGKLSYKVWMRWVECRLRPDSPHDTAVMQFRLLQR